jgi:hypothetical protein
MRRHAVILCLLLLAACDTPQPPKQEWKCIDGLTYGLEHGAWVLLDGRPYVNRKDGPIKCAADATGGPK